MILLLILKWIGIILLSLLLFLLVCLFYLIIFPMHIQASGEEDSRDKTLELYLSVRGFLYFWGLDLVLERKEETKIRVSFLWGLVTVYRGPKAVRRTSSDRKNQDRIFADKVTGQTVQQRQKMEGLGDIQLKKAGGKPKQSKENAGIPQKQEQKERGGQPGQEATHTELCRKRGKKIKKRPKRDGVREKISVPGMEAEKEVAWTEKMQSVLILFRQKESKKSLKFLWKRLKKLLRSFHLRLRDKMCFSLDDPQNTAYAAGLLSLLPLVYQKGVSVQPDFTSEDIYISSKFCLRMRLALRSFLWAAVRIWLNQDCRKSYHRIKEIIGK